MIHEQDILWFYVLMDKTLNVKCLKASQQIPDSE